LLAEAKSDLVNVLSRLEAHWVVLEAELVEINKDITFSEQCVQKYGWGVQCCVELPEFLLRSAPVMRRRCLVCHCADSPLKPFLMLSIPSFPVHTYREYFTYPLQHLKVGVHCVMGPGSF
jgi:hypothetical protein